MNISRFLLVLLLLSNSSIFAKDNIEIHIFQPSIRIGFDVAGIINRVWQPEILQIEITADSEFTPNWFIAAEGGYLDIDISRESFDYNSGGIFFRLGTDYNLLKKREPESNDVVLLSLRYGFSMLTHYSDRIIINDSYWGDFPTDISAENLNSHWLELGFALKTELFKNIFIGWSFRGRYLLHSTKDPMLSPYNIPGFGKVRSNNTALSMHYGIFYRIPF